MTTLIQLPNIAEQRLVLPSVTWQQYENLLTVFGDRSGLRLIYREGTLEIFMPSAEHERIKKIVARLIERYAEELDIPLHGCGSTTFRQAATAQGLEPDESYCVGILKELPDFAIEINLTSGGINKLAIYRGLGIPEVLVWENNKLTLYDLRESIDLEVVSSHFFPGLDFQLLARYIQPQNQTQAIKDFLAAIRSK